MHIEGNKPLPTERQSTDPSPRGMGDNNRGIHEPKQSSYKVFQNPEEDMSEVHIYQARQHMNTNVPFNIDDGVYHK